MKTDAQIVTNTRTVTVRYFRVGVEAPDLAAIYNALSGRGGRK